MTLLSVCVSICVCPSAYASSNFCREDYQVTLLSVCIPTYFLIRMLKMAPCWLCPVPMSLGNGPLLGIITYQHYLSVFPHQFFYFLCGPHHIKGKQDISSSKRSSCYKLTLLVVPLLLYICIITCLHFHCFPDCFYFIT
jgi:hypothetical protein